MRPGTKDSIAAAMPPPTAPADAARKVPSPAKASEVGGAKGC
jgi:hypothetical protein